LNQPEKKKSHFRGRRRAKKNKSAKDNTAPFGGERTDPAEGQTQGGKKVPSTIEKKELQMESSAKTELLRKKLRYCNRVGRNADGGSRAEIEDSRKRIANYCL